MAVNIDLYNKIKIDLNIDKVTLVAVSKLKSVDDIKNLYNLGQREFGENYVQELLEKQALLPKDINWHFIGHLQTNKVKYIAPFVHLIQSVDSEKLLIEINKQADKCNRQINCLLQIHVAQEETKFGLDEEDVKKIMDNAHLYKCVNICGIMGMASFSDNVQILKSEFSRLTFLFNKYFSAQPSGILSMGMSSDYITAIEEGSNMVRIGSLLFGARQ